MIPTILPNVAPIAIDGTKIPAGTLHPYETTTSPRRMTVARSNEFATGHCTDVLYPTPVSQIQCRPPLRGHILADILIIPIPIAFSEENRQHLCHVDPEESVEVAHHRSQDRKCDRFGHTVIR